MFYFEEEKNKIQAGLALKIGKLILQYSELNKSFPEYEKYDATLILCCLHTLLTNCSELLKNTKRQLKVIFEAPITDIPAQFGIKKTHIIQNTFNEEITYIQFIEHLRNALSHPTHSTDKKNLPSTGYYTINEDLKVINKFCFIDSPWVDYGDIHSRYSFSCSKLSDEAIEKNKADLENIKKLFEKNNNIELFIKEDTQVQRFKIYQNEKVYFPVFIAEISLDDMYKIAIELSNYLAQPTQSLWDGKEIKELVA